MGIQVKKVLGENLAEVPQPDKWRLLYLEKLLDQRGEMIDLIGPSGVRAPA